ncbi:MAG: hypothetical protein KDA28_16920, partial [Phycisphaerales bacterium]|nr:hypothetical protein [Phycisphaerales bacterium]
NHVGRNVWGSITIANQSREVRLQKRSPDPARSWVVTIGVDETSREDSSGTEIDPEPVNVEFWNRDTSSDTIRIEVDPRTLICRGDVDDRTFDEALCDELLREWRPDLPPDSSEVASIVDGITSATLGTVELKSWSDHDAALAFDVIGSSSSSSSSSRPDPRIGHLVRATVIAGWIAGVALLIILLFARRRSIRRDASR